VLVLGARAVLAGAEAVLPADAAGLDAAAAEPPKKLVMLLWFDGVAAVAFFFGGIWLSVNSGVTVAAVASYQLLLSSRCELKALHGDAPIQQCMELAQAAYSNAEAVELQLDLLF
jgi:hypothetical protein